MVYENTGGLPNVLTATGGQGDDRNGWWSGMWIFAIVIM